MDMGSLLEPGMLVRHPQRPEWGIGQVQSNVGGRVTVNFPDAGKVVIDGAKVDLLPVWDVPS
ncbi:uncharacterized protein DUF3553 [Hasllibacter halocynthiae]|uniref:Uncharacterized protein DUF3553 n=2 Tax=Hasllibacter halocynthiae TaxID=595589 RepID=A0A2T0X8H2_9RHOB|nr:uncharacterized protein DUF3553 [Hasllibacter halocynthiae]